MVQPSACGGGSQLNERFGTDAGTVSQNLEFVDAPEALDSADDTPTKPAPSNRLDYEMDPAVGCVTQLPPSMRLLTFL